ncbi:hypothetical protein [Paraliomyxa miuraensis]|uniref:hypothetical protein n=1 Tax=Paraliomyxa miuraensis TaxID=376150 RepID=UPI002258ED72|nr:hypothetical protein [Paraliomyxa miuraensis]MCX4244173.1 hypothetical protein [Paraliomyxa miuraensis]
MAPPLPLANVAGPLALSFTAGRAAMVSEPAPEASMSVPAPPRLPPVPGEMDETTETTSDAPSETSPESPSESEPPQPEPVSTPAPGPMAPFEAAYDDEDPLEGAGRRDEPASGSDAAAVLLRPNTKRFSFSLFVGGSRALRSSYTYFNQSDFKAEAAIGGFDRSFTFGGFGVVQVTSGFPFNTLTLAPRLTVNRQLVPKYAFYFTTNVTVGYRATTYTGYGFLQGLASIGYHSALIGVGAGISAVLGERLLLSFRPLELELAVPAPSTVQINWSAMGGLGVLWGRD